MKISDISVNNPKTVLWTLQIFGWMACGLILFLSGLGHQSILSSIVRNSLFAFLGFALSFLLRKTYKKLWSRHHSLVISGIATFFFSYLCGVISGLILNPVTFYFFRGGLGPEPLSALFAGVLNFALVFMIWSACYYAVKYNINPLSNSQNQNKYLQRLSVVERKQILPLKTQEISHFEAERDYIKIHVNNTSHLLRKTLRDLETQLDPLVFQRIHRSCIVNTNFVTALKPHNNGEYFVILSNGAELKLSRNYRHVLKSHFGTTL